jgi:putative transcriptional regulator
MKNNIRYLRSRLNLRQEDLARKLGVTRQTINAIENDKYNPSLELAMKVAKLFNTSVEAIFQLDDK